MYILKFCWLLALYTPDFIHCYQDKPLHVSSFLFSVNWPEHVHAVSDQNIVKKTTRGTAEATQAIKTKTSGEGKARVSFRFFQRFGHMGATKKIGVAC